MKVRWSERALQSLDEIRAYVAVQGGERIADRLVDRIFDRSAQLASFPRSGRVVPESNAESVREVFEGPYRLLYTVSAEEVYVIGVFHGAQDLAE